MGNLVADSMRAKYPGVDAAFTNSGGLRQDLGLQPADRAVSSPCEITWGEMFAVLPFGNRSGDPHRSPARSCEQAFLERVLAGVQLRDRDRTVPAGLRTEGDVHLRRQHAAW